MGPCPEGHGELDEHVSAVRRHGVASMGPCPEGHGERIASAGKDSGTVALQWGRARRGTER